MPGSRCPETLRCPGDTAPGPAVRFPPAARGCGGPGRGSAGAACAGMGSGQGRSRRSPAPPALMDAQETRAEMAAGGSAGTARPGRATPVAGAGGCCDWERMLSWSRTGNQRICARGASGFFFIACPSVGTNSAQNFK